MDGEIADVAVQPRRGLGAATHRSESAGEKAAPTAGRVRAGAAGHDERARYIYDEDMRRASFNAAAYTGRMLQPHDASARLWETVVIPDLALIATVAIFIATSVGVAIGKIADSRIDRAGAALLGSAYH